MFKIVKVPKASKVGSVTMVKPARYVKEFEKCSGL